MLHIRCLESPECMCTNWPLLTLISSRWITWRLTGSEWWLEECSLCQLLCYTTIPSGVDKSTATNSEYRCSELLESNCVYYTEYALIGIVCCGTYAVEHTREVSTRLGYVLDIPVLKFIWNLLEMHHIRFHAFCIFPRNIWSHRVIFAHSKPMKTLT